MYFFNFLLSSICRSNRPNPRWMKRAMMIQRRKLHNNTRVHIPHSSESFKVDRLYTKKEYVITHPPYLLIIMYVISHCQYLALKWRLNNWAGGQTRISAAHKTAMSWVTATAHSRPLWTHVQISVSATDGGRFTFSGKRHKQFLFHPSNFFLI